MSSHFKYPCHGCSKTFASQRALLSHQQQTPCIWVLQQRNQAIPTQLQDFLDTSDHEDDPPHAHLNDAQNRSAADDEGELSDDLFAFFPGAESPPVSSSHTATRPSPASPPVTASERQSRHDAASRALVEQTLASEPSTTRTFPNAGDVLRYDSDICKDFKSESLRDKSAYAPFKHELDWAVARWAKEEAVGSNALTRLLSIPGVVEKLDLSYHNCRALNQTIDELPGNPPWLESSFLVSHKQTGTTSHPLRFRDPLACIKALYGNIDFVENMAFGPVQEFSDEEQPKRVYNEMHTGDWWWETQASLPVGSTVVPIILSSDKTQLSAFSGDQQVHPVYLTIGNIAKELRRKPSYRSQILIAYLPIADLSHLSDDVARVVRARMFHSAMSVVLNTLKAAGTSGIHMTSGDGAVRRCYPILAVYIADHPEQCLVCCTRYMQCCPKCTATASEFGEHALANWKRRKQKVTLQTIHRASRLSTQTKRDEVLKLGGITSVDKPFWEGFPLANIHDTISPDILHQLIQGMIKHLIEWVTALIGAAELDARLKRLPETHGVRHFVNGISGLSQISGPERKEMCKQLVGCLVGKVATPALRAARALVDFLYIAQYSTHSEDTLKYMKDALTQFHKDKDIFIKESVRTLPNFNLPKLHMLEHYAPDIRSIGTTDNSNTEFAERLHIDNAKHAYDATNKKDNYVEQMTRWLDRCERISLFNVRIRWRLHALPTPPRVRSRQARVLAAGPTLPKQPTLPFVTFTVLSKSYHAPLFAHALRAFIAIHRCRSDRERTIIRRRRNHNSIVLPFNWVEVWHRASFAVGDIQDDTTQTSVTAITVNPNYGRNNVGRFDTVLVDTGSAEPTGMKDLRVARVRALFRIPSRFNDALFTGQHTTSIPQHLAYVEWFTISAPKDQDHQMYTVTQARKKPDVAVIEVSSIRRNCQLIPLFGEKDANRAWSTANVLDRCEKFLVNNYQDHHAFQSIW